MADDEYTRKMKELATLDKDKYELVEKKKQEWASIIFDKIDEAKSRGEWSVVLDLWGLDDFDTIEYVLEAFGYKVKIMEWSSMRPWKVKVSWTTGPVFIAEHCTFLESYNIEQSSIKLEHEAYVQSLAKTNKLEAAFHNWLYHEKMTCNDARLFYGTKPAEFYKVLDFYGEESGYNITLEDFVTFCKDINGECYCLACEVVPAHLIPTVCGKCHYPHMTQRCIPGLGACP